MKEISLIYQKNVVLICIIFVVVTEMQSSVSLCVKGHDEILFWILERNCLQIVIVVLLLAYHTSRGKWVWSGCSWPSM